MGCPDKSIEGVSHSLSFVKGCPDKSLNLSI